MSPLLSPLLLGGLLYHNQLIECYSLKGYLMVKKVVMGRMRTFFFFFLLFRATPSTYGGSQARGRIGAAATGLYHSLGNVRSESSLTYTAAAHSNTGSLTHWAKPGILPASSWILVGFVNRWAMKGTPRTYLYTLKIESTLYYDDVEK